MLKLFRSDYEKALRYVKTHGRHLEALLLESITKSNHTEIIQALETYQNEDGGFGHGLEPDSLLPLSTAVDTEFAIIMLSQVGIVHEDMNKKIIDYLENTYDKALGFWPISRPEINDYPRAVWWNYDTNESFGKLNPTATFIGFLYQYAPNTIIDVNSHINSIKDYILNTPVDQFDEHEIFCLVRCLGAIPEMDTEAIQNKMNDVIENLIETSSEKWASYVPEPVKYITSPNHPLYKKYADIVEENIDFNIKQMKEGVWWPKHIWYQYDDVFEAKAKYHWMGYYTFENFKKLNDFNRLVL